MTQYLFSVHYDYDQTEPPADEMQAMYDTVEVFNEELRTSGAWVFGGGLHEPSTATVVKAHEGDTPVITDGPYAETKEALGGFWIVEAADLDAALAMATKASGACQAPIEVRPFQDEPAS